MLKKIGRVGALLFLVACTGDTTPDPKPSSDPGIQYDVTEDGVVKKGRDPSDGTFSLPVDSPSPDWLEMRAGAMNTRRVFLPKGAREPDLSTYNFGRSGLQFPSRRTDVDVEIAGLDWHMGDSLQLVSPNVGLSIHNLETLFTVDTPAANAMRGTSFNWKIASSPLIDDRKGDTTWVAQMTLEERASGGFYNVLTHAGIATGFAVRDGERSKLATTLASVKLDHRLQLRWQGSAYAAIAKDAGTGARPAPAPSLSIRTLPEALARNNKFFATYYIYLPSLVDFGPVSGTTDFAETVQYGNPFSSDKVKWTELVTLSYSIPVSVRGVGTLNARIVQGMLASDLEANAFAPAISPVRNVQINGKPADAAAIAGVGPSPTITWDAPALGTATNYLVTVHVASNGPDRLKELGTFTTSSPSLTLPSFITKGVDSYVLRITAVSAAGRDLATQPYSGVLPYASADHVTAKITQ